MRRGKIRRMVLALMLTTLSVSSGAKANAQAAAPLRQEQETLATLPPEVAEQPAFQVRHPRYQLRPSDVLELNFAFTPEFNQVVSVQPDGYITLKDAGDMHIQGHSVPEVQRMLAVAYGRILHDPVITVVLKDFEKPYFVAGGELRNPGKFDMRGETTVTQAIALAGGFTSVAKHSEVLLFRRMSESWVKVSRINVKKMLNSEDLREDVHLRPGDMIFVPKNRMSKLREWLPAWRMSTPVSGIPLGR
jgi:polysaccharide export outer membrane protein